MSLGLILSGLTFYLFATIAVLSGFFVVFSRNPVHSVLFLILTFFSTAGLFVLAGAQYLAMLLVVVYVGAVAVLFLFVVMMLNVDFVSLRSGFRKHAKLAIPVALLLLAELMFVIFKGSQSAPSKGTPKIIIDDVDAIGTVLYTNYIYLFQLAGLILFVAMIGAIVLAHRKRPGVQRQSALEQVTRKRHEAVDIVDVKSGEGLS